MLDFLDKWAAKGTGKYRKGSIPRMQAPPEPPVKQAAYDGAVGYNRVWAVRFDGEKNLGELGPIRKYQIDHAALRLRSWQAYLESEICQLVFRRNTTWVIGNGLKLQAEPKKTVLAGEKITIEPEAFNNAVEDRFAVYANSTMADYADLDNLHGIAAKGFTNSIVGGDVLVVLRYLDSQVKVQLIDGAHVATPLGLELRGSDFVYTNGNRVKHGIEIDARGRHIAYHVQQANMTFERIPARGERSGALMAFIIYGLEYRLDNVRGLPLIAAVMETAKKVERYKEATVGSAEERQKIPYTIEHGMESTGENPLLERMAKVSGFTSGDDIPRDVQGQRLADKVAATTNKTVVNMPIGAKMQALESRNELGFRDFLGANIELVCATVEIPPEVALQKYDSNYSASRAAIKDWEHTLNKKRKQFADKFYQNVYNFWLDVQILAGKIAAPGYLTAIVQKNEMAIAAYRSARFVGASVPHIDPLKEVQAERLKLGTGGAHLPLTTLEAATETLNGGDSASNLEQYATEMEKADSLGIERIEPLPPPTVDEETPPPPKKDKK